MSSHPPLAAVTLVFCSIVDGFAACCAPRSTPSIVHLGDQIIVRITPENLADCMLVDTDGEVLDSAILPYVLMPDPKVREIYRPCQLWLVTKDDAGLSSLGS